MSSRSESAESIALETLLDHLRAATAREVERLEAALAEATAPASKAILVEQSLCALLIQDVALESLAAIHASMDRLEAQDRAIDAMVDAHATRARKLAADITEAEGLSEMARMRARDPELPAEARSAAESTARSAEETVRFLNQALGFQQMQPALFQIARRSNEGAMQRLNGWRADVLQDLERLHGKWNRDVRSDAWAALAKDVVGFAGGFATLLLGIVRRRLPDLVDPIGTADSPEARIDAEWARARERLVSHYGWCLNELDRVEVLEQVALGGDVPSALIERKAETGELLYPREVVARLGTILERRGWADDAEAIEKPSS